LKASAHSRAAPAHEVHLCLPYSSAFVYHTIRQLPNCMIDESQEKVNLRRYQQKSGSRDS
jgi:hypothetical protein